MNTISFFECTFDNIFNKYFLSKKIFRGFFIIVGSRTVSTVGGKITKLTPSKSFATQMGAAVAVLTSSVLGMPVSTSHCLVGAVVGIGAADRCMRGGGEVSNIFFLFFFLSFFSRLSALTFQSDN